MSGHGSASRRLALDCVRVVEAAALAGARLMGRGDERAVDRAAAEAMHRALGELDIDGTVVIGDGDGEVEQLEVGARVGSGAGPEVDVALVPLEGTTIAARGGPNAISCIALAPRGCLLDAPDIYMEKIAVGGGLPAGLIDLAVGPRANLARLAEAKGIAVEDLVVLILDRPRHEQLIREVREAGARIRLITDGDVAGVIATARPDSGIDIYLGIGGAPEGVLAAAALGALGGQFQGRLVFRNDDDRLRARQRGIADLERTYDVADLACGDVVFAATGVTDGTILKGVRRAGRSLLTQSIVLRSRTGTVRLIETEHSAARKVAPTIDPDR